jgi:hypothetical protein
MFATVTVAGSRWAAGDSSGGSGEWAMVLVEVDADGFKMPPEGKAIGRVLAIVGALQDAPGLTRWRNMPELDGKSKRGWFYEQPYDCSIIAIHRPAMVTNGCA